jgi:hypothetical protein
MKDMYWNLCIKRVSSLQSKVILKIDNEKKVRILKENLNILHHCNVVILNPKLH